MKWRQSKADKSSLRPEETKIDKNLVKEIIARCEQARVIVNTIVLKKSKNPNFESFGLDEDNSFKENREWLQTNYPKVASELSKYPNLNSIDPNKDPISQILEYSSLYEVFKSDSTYEEFDRNLGKGIIRLCGYLRYIS